jgi:RNA polymerase sigma factor (sigma-70 family)
MSRAVVPSGLGVGLRATAAPADEKLAQRAADGEERAFAEIFDRYHQGLYRYHQGLYRYCLALVGNPADAQDALQNTMIKVLRALPGEERRIELKPWLYRIAHNESIELLRHRRETRPLSPDLVAAGSGLMEAAATRERLRVLVSDLGKLPERQRGALVMRELLGLDFAEIGAVFGTSEAVVRQTLYEARLSLRQMDEGRAMSCERVTRALSDGDGRSARRRDLRTHLRSCENCRGFSKEIEHRERDFAALAPLPVAAVAGLLQSLLGDHGAVGGSFAGALGGGAVTSLGASVALKGAATVAVVAAIGVGAADRGGLIDVGLPGGARSQSTRVEQAAAGGSPATPSASVAAEAATGSVAGAKGAHDSATAEAAKPVVTPESGGAGVLPGSPRPADPGKAGADQVTSAGGAGPDAAPLAIPAAQGNSVAQDDPASNPHEKQLPSASEHGQETAASHKAANHGQETAADHKAEGHGSEAQSHPAHPATPSHPSPDPSPGAEEESAPPTSPAASEPNGSGNAKGKGNGKGNLPAAAPEKGLRGRKKTISRSNRPARPTGW